MAQLPNPIFLALPGGEKVSHNVAQEDSGPTFLYYQNRCYLALR